MSIGLPSTFTAAVPNEEPGRPRVFDPALKQFPFACRPGDPSFTRPGEAARWHLGKRRATDHVLRIIAESEWGASLVLRGSRLLTVWLPEWSREPGDLDWVARPASVRLGSREANKLLAGLVSAVRHRPSPPGVYMPPTATSEDIWTYERAAGRRIVFPWKCEGLPGGAVQVDVVFSEELPTPPARTIVPTADGAAPRPGPPRQVSPLTLAGHGQAPAGKTCTTPCCSRWARREVLEETFRNAGVFPYPALALYGPRTGRISGNARGSPGTS